MEVSGQHYALAKYPWEVTLVPTEYEARWILEPVWVFWRNVSCPLQETNPGLSNLQPSQCTVLYSKIN